MKLKFLVFAVLCLACAKKKEVTQPVVNDLPAMVITKTDGTIQAMKYVSGKAVLVMFQPDCDHCQREATQIRNNLDAFKEYQLYFISSPPMYDVEKFSVDYKFKSLPNVYFGITTVNEVINAFGPIDAPSVYIYDETGRLRKSFSGETDIKLILASL